MGIYETSYPTLKDEEIRRVYRSMKLPDDFSFPQVFVFGLNEKGDWIGQFQRLDREQATVEGLKTSISSIRANREKK